jgi:3D (Asp-Asp-Asp) domain-containing protein
MRDQHIRAIEHKIHRIRTYKRIGKMLIVTVILVAGINLVSNIDDAMTEKEIQKAVLSEENEINDTNIDQAEKVAEIENQNLVATYSDTNYTQVQDMVITHYCACEKCCGKYADGITATGTKATANKTIAVDPNVIPLGSEVIIDGQLYIAEDTGGAIKGNRIDIFCDSHQEAINRGKITREVQIEKTSY